MIFRRFPLDRINWTTSTFLIGTFFLTLTAVPAYIWAFGLSWFNVALFVSLSIATGLSITLGYHRLFSHFTFQAKWPVRLATLIFGAAAFENSALQWSSEHRKHHKHVDHEDDPYDISKGFFYAHIGWRGMFMVGAAPALLVLYVRRHVDESPAWQQREHRGAFTWRPLIRQWRLFLYVILLMTAFNFFSHGTQDFYPLFLQKQHNFDVSTVSRIAVVYNIGAILGGLAFGNLSERIGRKRTIISAALLVLPFIPLWAYARSAVLLASGAFIIQFLVQGAWSVVPVHLNELSPGEVRGTFPGFTYQLGNLFASGNLYLQSLLVERSDGNFSLALASVAAVVAVSLSVITCFGPEARGIAFVSRAKTT